MGERPILVIGGGPAGMEAARGIAEVGYKAILVEKRDTLGGTPELANYAALTPDFRDAGEAMAEMAAAIQNDPGVEIRTGTTVTGATGQAGAFDVNVTRRAPARRSSRSAPSCWRPASSTSIRAARRSSTATTSTTT